MIKTRSYFRQTIQCSSSYKNKFAVAQKNSHISFYKEQKKTFHTISIKITVDFQNPLYKSTDERSYANFTEVAYRYKTLPVGI